MTMLKWKSTSLNTRVVCSRLCGLCYSEENWAYCCIYEYRLLVYIYKATGRDTYLLTATIKVYCWEFCSVREHKLFRYVHALSVKYLKKGKHVFHPECEYVRELFNKPEEYLVDAAWRIRYAESSQTFNIASYQVFFRFYNSRFAMMNSSSVQHYSLPIKAVV